MEIWRKVVVGRAWMGVGLTGGGGLLSDGLGGRDGCTSMLRLGQGALRVRLRRNG